MKRLLLLIFIFSLTACQTLNKTKPVSDVSLVPEPNIYSANAHPLGLGHAPDKRTSGYAYLLLADSAQNEPERAQLTCQALFSGANLDKPTAALGQHHLVTYFPVNKAGDFQRVSSRFKWSMCKRLSSLTDKKRESKILSKLGYAQTRGPILVAVDSSYKAVQDEQQHSLIADLSMVPNDELPVVIQNWVNGVAMNRDLWQKSTDLGRVNELLSEGLTNRRVALTILPEAMTVKLAGTHGLKVVPSL